MVKLLFFMLGASVVALTVSANSALAKTERLTSCETLANMKYPSVARHKAFASLQIVPGLGFGLACGGAGPYATVEEARSSALATCERHARKYLKETKCHIVKSE